MPRIWKSSAPPACAGWAGAGRDPRLIHNRVCRARPSAASRADRDGLSQGAGLPADAMTREPIWVLDACVLYPTVLREILHRFGRGGVACTSPQWSPRDSPRNGCATAGRAGRAGGRRACAWPDRTPCRPASPGPGWSTTTADEAALVAARPRGYPRSGQGGGERPAPRASSRNEPARFPAPGACAPWPCGRCIPTRSCWGCSRHALRRSRAWCATSMPRRKRLSGATLPLRDLLKRAAPAAAGPRADPLVPGQIRATSAPPAPRSPQCVPRFWGGSSARPACRARPCPSAPRAWKTGLFCGAVPIPDFHQQRGGIGVGLVFVLTAQPCGQKRRQHIGDPDAQTGQYPAQDARQRHADRVLAGKVDHPPPRVAQRHMAQLVGDDAGQFPRPSPRRAGISRRSHGSGRSVRRARPAR